MSDKEEVLRSETFSDAIRMLEFAAKAMNIKGDLDAWQAYHTGAEFLGKIQKESNLVMINPPSAP